MDHAIDLREDGANLESTPPEPAPDSQHVAVLEELDRLQKQQSTWPGILVLAISMMLFLGAGAVHWDWTFALMLIPILLIHETGHWVAMKAFGYRDLRMFFIPFFGAAVSGRSYHVAGWKKSLVALMGPVPSVLLAVLLGVAGLVSGAPQLVDIALLALIVNGFNLLPILPLDGGQNLHAVLFDRHPLLDVAFRAIAAAALITGSAFLGDWLLVLIGIWMVFGLPESYRIARTIAELRSENHPAAASGDDVIPRESAVRIIDHLVPTTPAGPLQNRILARRTLRVFEALSSRPPGLIASLLLLMVHAGAFLIAVVAIVFFVASKQPAVG